MQYGAPFPFSDVSKDKSKALIQKAISEKTKIAKISKVEKLEFEVLI